MVCIFVDIIFIRLDVQNVFSSLALGFGIYPRNLLHVLGGLLQNDVIKVREQLHISGKFNLMFKSSLT